MNTQKQINANMLSLLQYSVQLQALAIICRYYNII